MGRWLAWLAALFALALPAAAFAQDGPLLPHPILVSADMREALDLSGPWTWSVDPYRDGLYGFHGEPAGEGHRRWDDRDVEQAMRDNPNALFEYDMRR
ncbi:MAG: beta-glucuronidase, partial [Sphingomonadaceae bacterium]|nr:beta-glucuronidase [Sphingomonadaceae bacterium]